MTRGQTWRRFLASAGVLLGAYGLCLVVLAPATLLDAGLRRASAGQLRLAQARGTLWSGSGQLEIRDRTGRGAVGKALSWTLQPRALWRGRLDFAVAIDHVSERFPVRITLRGIELSDANFSLPASALGVAVPPLAALGPRGELVFHIAKFARTDDAVAADAVVTWKDASSTLTTVAPLGTYELRFNNVAESLRATLRTRSGPLRLDGGGSWRGDGPLVFSATARVAAAYRARLSPLLRLIAVEHGDDDFVLQLSSPFAGGAVHAAPAQP